MPRNIEIKARLRSVDELLPRARALADGDVRCVPGPGARKRKPGAANRRASCDVLRTRTTTADLSSRRWIY